MHFKMSIFKKHRTLDFSDENIKSLSESIVNLKSILSKVGTSIGSQQLNNVLASAMRKDSESFKKNTLTNEMHYLVERVLFGNYIVEMMIYKTSLIKNLKNSAWS